MATIINELPNGKELSLSQPRSWCINIFTDIASTAQIIREAEPGKKHWIDNIIVTCHISEWFEILDGDDVLLGPIGTLGGVPWNYPFKREIHGSENKDLKIKTKTNSHIHVLIEGHTDAYTEYVFNPSPADEAVNIAITPSLSWDSAPFIGNFDVYLGTSLHDVVNANKLSPEYKITQTGQTYNPSTLNYNTTYFWRIDADSVHNIVWKFTTMAEES